MITGADEYPFHQTPEPMAYAGTDRNFYDRYFFNGYSPDGEIFFAIAFGVYPNLDIMDGAVSILHDGKQHNVRASKRMQGERSVLQVGPLSIHIEQPLRKSRIVLADNDSGMTIDVTMTARHAPVEEPRFTRRIGTRSLMDYTRMTQNVEWSGSVSVDGYRFELDGRKVRGTRDRSWGIRPVGLPDPQPPAAGGLSQFFWLWNPCNFDDYVAFSHTNDDEYGRPWNRLGAIQAIGGDIIKFDEVEYQYEWEGPSSRKIKELRALCQSEQGDAVLTFRPTATFFMPGLGYMHPEWGHGTDHGDLAVTHDTWDVHQCLLDPRFLHIQAISDVTLEFQGAIHQGTGVVEQMFVGTHAPTGMGEGLDVDRS
jgi:hypothetical protein